MLSRFLLTDERSARDLARALLLYSHENFMTIEEACQSIFGHIDPRVRRGIMLILGAMGHRSDAHVDEKAIAQLTVNATNTANSMMHVLKLIGALGAAASTHDIRMSPGSQTSLASDVLVVQR